MTVPDVAKELNFPPVAGVGLPKTVKKAVRSQNESFRRKEGDSHRFGEYVELSGFGLSSAYCLGFRDISRRRRRQCELQ